jgi:hypothetical protein
MKLCEKKGRMWVKKSGARKYVTLLLLEHVNRGSLLREERRASVTEPWSTDKEHVKYVVVILCGETNLCLSSIAIVSKTRDHNVQTAWY